MKPRQVSFGDLKIGPTARKYIDRALSKNWVSEGDNVAEFERRFAEKFQWKHAIATSSGTDAGIVVWSAIRELIGLHHYAEGVRHPADCKGHIITPACAFVSTANVILAAGMRPVFLDINLDTLNINLGSIQTIFDAYERELLPIAGIQFVATMGKPTPIDRIAAIADEQDPYLVSDSCEAHGAKLLGGRHHADRYADVSIYSFYCAHLIVAGEGGMICTDDDEIANLCRSIKCHGYGPGPRFDFKTIGFNAKMNELTAAVGIEGLARFDKDFKKRRAVRAGLIERLARFEDRLILYRDAPGEIIAPHAFPIILRDESADVMPLYHHLESEGIQVKSLFGSLATQHSAFAFLGHKLGDFPVAERVGRTGIHFGCHQFMTEDDLDYIAEVVEDGLKKFYGA